MEPRRKMESEGKQKKIGPMTLLRQTFVDPESHQPVLNIDPTREF